MPSSPVSEPAHRATGCRGVRADGADEPEQPDTAAELAEQLAEAARIATGVRCADLDNYRKRAAREIERRVEESRESLLRDWLEARRQRRARAADRERPEGALSTGLRAVLDQMEGILARQGVERIGEAGEPFDPERHEAVGVRESEERARRTVVDVARSGYAIGDRVLRPAQVIVSRGPDAELMAVAFRDYYEASGSPRGASTEDIRRAYRKLARKYHPDVNKDAGAEDRFKEISEAYEVLRDPEKRERYDRLGAELAAGQDVSGPASAGSRASAAAAFGDVRVRLRRRRRTSATSSTDSSAAARGGRGAGGSERLLTRGADQEAELELSLEEAARRWQAPDLARPDGRDYEVTIPPGVRDGQRIRLAGEGGPGIGGGPSGDLFLRVRLGRTRASRGRARPLHRPAGDARGRPRSAPTVEVRTLTAAPGCKVPAGSSCGRRLRLRGEGMPDARRAGRPLRRSSRSWSRRS